MYIYIISINTCKCVICTYIHFICQIYTIFHVIYSILAFFTLFIFHWTWKIILSILKPSIEENKLPQRIVRLHWFNGNLIRDSKTPYIITAAPEAEHLKRLPTIPNAQILTLGGKGCSLVKWGRKCFFNAA